MGVATSDMSGGATWACATAIRKGVRTPLVPPSWQLMVGTGSSDRQTGFTAPRGCNDPRVVYSGGSSVGQARCPAGPVLISLDEQACRTARKRTRNRRGDLRISSPVCVFEPTPRQGQRSKGRVWPRSGRVSGPILVAEVAMTSAASPARVATNDRRGNRAAPVRKRMIAGTRKYANRFLTGAAWAIPTWEQLQLRPSQSDLRVTGDARRYASSPSPGFQSGDPLPCMCKGED